MVKEWGISRGDYIELKFLITLSAVGEEEELRVLRKMTDISIQEWIFFSLEDYMRINVLESILIFFRISEK